MKKKNLTIEDAMREVTREMLRWPKWYFKYQLWKHRNGDIARALRELREFAESKEFAEVMEKYDPRPIEKTVHVRPEETSDADGPDESEHSAAQAEYNE